MSLKNYHKKRNFKKTPEPTGILSHNDGRLFIIQKHAASHLHYDFRLELKGVLLSWAVPKGPCYAAGVKRLAVHVEDHPLAYGSFEGIIPQGEYGGGTVMLWDQGIWQPLDENPAKAYESGHLRFELFAEKLQGRWDLIRFKDEKHWFLIKYDDPWAKSENYDITEEKPESVVSGLSILEIAERYKPVWTGSTTVKANTLAKIVKKTKVRKTKIKLLDDLNKSPFPEAISPQLATLADKAPEGESWLHELKLDGYRILAFIEGNDITLKSRTNKNWTRDLVPVVDALKQLSVKKVIFDGEVVLLNKEGKSDFQLLQNTIKVQADAPYVYYIFDILYYDQYDLRKLPLIKRKEILEEVLANQDETLRYSTHIVNQGGEVFEQSCKLGLEGIISKQLDSPYLSKRSKSWLKIKCLKRQEFIIGGYSNPQGGRQHFGALYLGYYNFAGELEYAGNVGTGFTNTSLKDIFLKLMKNHCATSPFAKKIPASGTVNWVNPLLVGEVEFSQWTQEGHLRHPSFKGLRADKNPEDVIREQETSLKKVDKVKATTLTKTKKSAAMMHKSSFLITHPEKIVYGEDKFTKEDVLIYYEAVCAYILPYLINRPLSLFRCPDNYEHCFFQRHYTASTPKALKPIKIQTKEDVEDYIYLKDKEGLLSLVQMGVLEIHPWGSQIKNLDCPDMIIIDLDPAPDVTWQDIVDAALEIKHHLEQFNLTSFVKTTGGKGLHVVIPIKPEYDWEEIKHFTHVFVLFVEKLRPERYISKMTKAKRGGKIFVDYLRNLRGATAISAYSTRARIHAPVSAPVYWDELTANKRDTEFNIKTLPPRLASLKDDPWGDFWTVKQSLNLKDLE